MQPRFADMNSEYNSTWSTSQVLTPPPSNKTEISDYLSHHSASSTLVSISTLPLSPPADNDLCQTRSLPHTCLTPEILDQHHEHQTSQLQNPLYLWELQQEYDAELSAAMQSLEISFFYNHTYATQLGLLPMARFQNTSSDSYRHQLAFDASPPAPYISTTHHLIELNSHLQTSGRAQPSFGSQNGHPQVENSESELELLSEDARLQDVYLCGVGTKFEEPMVYDQDAIFDALCKQLASAPLTYKPVEIEILRV